MRVLRRRFVNGACERFCGSDKGVYLVTDYVISRRLMCGGEISQVDLKSIFKLRVAGYGLVIYLQTNLAAWLRIFKVNKGRN